MLVIIFCIVIDQGELLVDFRQLETFVEVCEQMSFTKAASNLYISQQGVSKSIKTLEDELGVSLFLRTNSSISLTNYGVILQRYAEDLVNNYTKVLTSILKRTAIEMVSRLASRTGLRIFFRQKSLRLI